MGLDTSHDCWHGGYSSFNVWRNKLAELAGYPLVKDDNSALSYPSNIEWHTITKDNLNGKWKSTPNDPLLILICHYDCEGRIYFKHTKLLANRLIELLPLIESWEESNMWYRGKTETFIRGLLTAHENCEHVEFH